MKASEKAKLAILIGGMAETYRQVISEAGIEGFWLGLSDLSFDQFNLAVGKALRASKWMPTVSELRGFAGIKTPEQEASDAWDTFCAGVQSVGYYGSIDFTDRRINAVAQHLGGWGRVCELSGDAFHVWLRKDFLATFADFAQRGVDCSGEYPLLGWVASQNGDRWPDHTPPPVLFGPPTDQKRIAHKRPKALPRVELQKVTERKEIER